MRPPPWDCEPRIVFGVVCLVVGAGSLLAAGLVGLEWHQQQVSDSSELAMGGLAIVLGIPLGVLFILAGTVVLTPRQKTRIQGRGNK